MYAPSSISAKDLVFTMFLNIRNSKRLSGADTQPTRRDTLGATGYRASLDQLDAFINLESRFRLELVVGMI